MSPCVHWSMVVTPRVLQTKKTGCGTAVLLYWNQNGDHETQCDVQCPPVWGQYFADAAIIAHYEFQFW